jgi:acetyl esterase/lipase
MSVIHDLAPHLDPELASAYRQIPVPAAKPSLAEMRAGLRAVCAQLRAALPKGDDVAVEDRYLPGADVSVPVRIFRPANAKSDTVLLWIHGGGFIAGHHEDDAIVCIPWVRALGCTVVSVGYRLAPEHRHPAASDDCYTALLWAAQTLKPRKLAVGGISAGGALAAATALRARDQHGPQVDLQMLLIPVIDSRCDTPSMRDVADPRSWNLATAQAAYAMYLGPQFREESSPYAVPARATDLSNLPPCYMEVAEIDCLRDEAIEYARRLMQAGVRTELHVYPGAFHASTVMLPGAAVSRRAFADCTAALCAALTLALRAPRRASPRSSCKSASGP